MDSPHEARRPATLAETLEPCCSGDGMASGSVVASLRCRSIFFVSCESVRFCCTSLHLEPAAVQNKTPVGCAGTSFSFLDAEERQI